MKAHIRSAPAALMLLSLLVLSALAARSQGMGEGGGGFAGGESVRGVVTAVSAERLTVKTEGGQSVEVVTTTNTRVMKSRQPVKLADIKPGDGVGAMGVMDAPAKTLHAAFVVLIDAEQMRRAQAELGKTFITGRITSLAVDDLKLTVQRPDGVAQTISVDEGTSFRRGGSLRADGARSDGAPGNPARTGATAPPGSGAPAGGKEEMITFADLKAGDMIAGKGALKNGIFVPSELHVLNGNGARARRRAEAEQPR